MPGTSQASNPALVAFAGQCDTAAGTISTNIQSLMNNLDELQNASAGAFANAFAVCRQEVAVQMNKLHTALTGMGVDVNQVAQGYDAADTDMESQMTTVTGEVTGVAVKGF